MHDEIKCCQITFGHLQSIHHAIRLIIGRAGHLGQPHRTGALIKLNQIGEGATHIYANHQP